MKHVNLAQCENVGLIGLMQFAKCAHLIKLSLLRTNDFDLDWDFTRVEGPLICQTTLAYLAKTIPTYCFKGCEQNAKVYKYFRANPAARQAVLDELNSLRNLAMDAGQPTHSMTPRQTSRMFIILDKNG